MIDLTCALLEEIQEVEDEIKKVSQLRRDAQEEKKKIEASIQELKMRRREIRFLRTNPGTSLRTRIDDAISSQFSGEDVITAKLVFHELVFAPTEYSRVRQSICERLRTGVQEGRLVKVQRGIYSIKSSVERNDRPWSYK